MEIKKNQTFKTPVGLFLKVQTVRESGLHTLVLIDKKGKAIPEKRNTRGHVIQRTDRLCTEETIRSFKKVAIALMLLLSTSGFAQNKFVLAENSVHKVVMTDHLKTIVFDGRVYEVLERKGWYRMRNDSITWVYGHDPKNFKDMVKIGFYNEFKNYVLSIKTNNRKIEKDVIN